jgi:hypothetical protein
LKEEEEDEDESLSLFLFFIVETFVRLFDLFLPSSSSLSPVFLFSHLGADGHVLSFSLTRPRLAAAKFPTVGPASYSSSSSLCALVEITPARRDQRHPH